MTNKTPKGVIWPPPPSDQEKVLHTNEPSSWSILETIWGGLVGAVLYTVFYVLALLLILNLGINIADNHKSWTVMYRMLGGLTQALPVLNLLWPILIFCRSKKRSMSFAVGILSGSLVVMLIALKVTIDMIRKPHGL